ncbi:phosphatase PAP2 family protein [Streptomyces sp. NPDC005132]|uniref:phosphatase PAP2 family protein n=1 Tax=Streptomyces sp. NPDC005132 TaxID=3154294 RepID=UPI0033AD8DA0
MWTPPLHETDGGGSGSGPAADPAGGHPHSTRHRPTTVGGGGSSGKQQAVVGCGGSDGHVRWTARSKVRSFGTLSPGRRAVGLNGVCKQLADRPRPPKDWIPHDEVKDRPDSSSFPSGHTAAAVAPPPSSQPARQPGPSAQCRPPSWR